MIRSADDLLALERHIQTHPGVAVSLEPAEVLSILTALDQALCNPGIQRMDGVGAVRSARQNLAEVLADGNREIYELLEPPSDDQQYDDWVLMPLSLTAENGAKAELMGEFFEEVTMHNPYYEEEEDVDASGPAFYTERVPVSWITIKAIYKRAVEFFNPESVHPRDRR